MTSTTLAPRFAILAFGAAWCALTTQVAGAAEQYPALTDAQWEQSKHLLVVAEIEPGEHYEPFPCPPNHVCMDGPPFWLKTKVESTVYGAAVPPRLRVSTTSHYGMALTTSRRGPYLMYLRSDGERYIMPRYAKLPLIRDKHGVLYLTVDSEHVSSWLPCGVATLREEIFYANFPGAAEISKNELGRYRVQEKREFYVFTSKGAWPRYAIPIERLRQFLEKSGPDVRMSCEVEPVERKS